MPKKETLPVRYAGLNDAQITIITQKTPRHLIKKRKGRGGKVFDYLPHGEVARILNEAFAHKWSFETEPIIQFCNDSEVTVKGILTVFCQDGNQIVKEQFGSQDILKDKSGKSVMPYGDALKGAASDALKKCASLLGIALDLYSNGHEYVREPVTPEPAQKAKTVNPEPVKESEKEPKSDESANPEPTPDKAKHKAKITQKQKNFILRLIKSHVFTQDEKDKAIEFANNPDTTKEKAIRFIESLQSHIEIRKKAEKELAPETDLQKVMRLRTEDPENFEKAWKDFQIAFNSETATEPEHFTHILRVYNAQGSVATA